MLERLNTRARSSVGLEYQASNLVVGGSSPSGRAISLGLTTKSDNKAVSALLNPSQVPNIDSFCATFVLS